ncbi:MAG: hypothetical protein KAR08_07540 [Candidatus Heimdallarchaeota archaeon]|nr:hypothetical protein [Candidatus Heimdallarchaeota archaeon]
MIYQANCSNALNKLERYEESNQLTDEELLTKIISIEEESMTTFVRQRSKAAFWTG